jgi:hypothetical protein
MHSDSACPELLARIRQLEEETARLQLLIAELVLKNQHLRRDKHAAGVCACNWTESQDSRRNKAPLPGWRRSLSG